MLHKVFVSYHHKEDQDYADSLRAFYGSNNTFVDRSLPEEIDSDDDDYILGCIRANHLRDSTVTIVLIGAHTWSRRWVDWEIYSSLRPYGNRTRNGLLGILLPTAVQWPQRFADNYRQGAVAGRVAQLGYARLVNWGDVCPPTLMDKILGFDTSVAQERRAKLMAAIQRAFDNRINDHLINNQRPRLRKNRPIGLW